MIESRVCVGARLRLEVNFGLGSETDASFLQLEMSEVGQTERTSEQPDRASVRSTEVISDQIFNAPVADTGTFSMICTFPGFTACDFDGYLCLRHCRENVKRDGERRLSNRIHLKIETRHRDQQVH